MIDYYFVIEKTPGEWRTREYFNSGPALCEEDAKRYAHDKLASYKSNFRKARIVEFRALED